MSKASKQRAVDPPLNTRNSTFVIVDRAWSSHDDWERDDEGYESYGEHDDNDDIGSVNILIMGKIFCAMSPLMYPIHL